LSGVFQNIDPPPPLHPASVSSPRTEEGNTHSPGGEGVGGSIFWKTPDKGFASYSIILYALDLQYLRVGKFEVNKMAAFLRRNLVPKKNVLKKFGGRPLPVGHIVGRRTPGRGPPVSLVAVGTRSGTTRAKVVSAMRHVAPETVNGLSHVNCGRLDRP
jgi:hypothetical protein